MTSASSPATRPRPLHCFARRCSSTRRDGPRRPPWTSWSRCTIPSRCRSRLATPASSRTAIAKRWPRTPASCSRIRRMAALRRRTTAAALRWSAWARTVPASLFWRASRIAFRTRLTRPTACSAAVAFEKVWPICRARRSPTVACWPCPAPARARWTHSFAWRSSSSNRGCSAPPSRAGATCRAG